MKWKDFKIVFAFVKPYWAWELLLLVLVLAGAVTGLALPYFLMLIIDRVIPSGDYEELMRLLGILTLVYIGRSIIGFAADYLNTWLGNQIVRNIKLKLFSNLLHMPFAYFETHKPGDILQQVNHEVDKVQHFLLSSIIRLLTNGATAISLGVVLFALNAPLFFMSAIVIPISIAVNRYFGNKLRKTVEASSKQEGGLYSFYFDRIKNIRLIKSFNAHEREMQDLGKRFNGLFGLYLRNAIYASSGRNLAAFLVALGPLVVFAYGGYQVMEKAMTIGALVAYIQYLNRLYAPSNDLIGLYVDYIRAHESVKRILPILQTIPPPGEQAGVQQLKNSSIERITIQKLHFGYHKKPILRNINLVFEKGNRYAIVGPSGSGKSTLMKLLCRLYDYKHGRILVNQSVDLLTIGRHEWMERVTVISQEATILHDTIRNNLLYGSAMATDEQMYVALEKAGLAIFVRSLPQQLDTSIGDGEDSIVPSGGQMQQLALARVFLRNSEVLILDETTSAVDSLCDKTIFDSIFHYGRDKIIIAISHRLSTIRDFDEVIYLENGEVQETGSHEALSMAGGGYFELFKQQLVKDTVK